MHHHQWCPRKTTIHSPVAQQVLSVVAHSHKSRHATLNLLTNHFFPPRGPWWLLAASANCKILLSYHLAPLTALLVKLVWFDCTAVRLPAWLKLSDGRNGSDRREMIVCLFQCSPAKGLIPTDCTMDGRERLERRERARSGDCNGMVTILRYGFIK